MQNLRKRVEQPEAIADDIGSRWAAAGVLVQRALDAPTDASRVAACAALADLTDAADAVLLPSRGVITTLIFGAQFYGLLGSHGDSAALALRAVALADQRRNTAAAQQALSIAGAMLADSGAVADGLVHTVAGLDLSVELVQPEAGSSAWYALAVALLAAGQSHSALLAAGNALALARLSDAAEHATRAMCVSAQAALYLDDVNAVLRMAQQCIERLGTARTLEQHVLMSQCQHHHARALARSGRVALAQQHARAAARHAAASGSALAHAYASVAAAMCDAAAGAHSAALAQLEGALGCGVPQIVLPAMHALTEVARRSGNRELLLAARRRLYDETRRRQSRAARLQSELARHAVAASDQRGFGGTTWLETRAALPAAPSDPLDRLEETAAAVEHAEHPAGVLRLFRCGRLAAMLAADLGWPQGIVDVLERAARLHAIGKLYVPPEITAKAGPLTDGERSMVVHSYALGAELLQAAGLGDHPILGDVVRHVCERWDAGGPQRIGGEAIPQAARIVAIAACYASLISVRPYRGALPHADAVAALREEAGRKFDPVLTEHAIALLASTQSRQNDLQRQIARSADANRYVQVSERIDDLLTQDGDGGRG